MKKLIALSFTVLSCSSIYAQCWRTVSANWEFNIAQKSDGTLWAWGFNADSRLGDGSTINRNIPVEISTDTDWSVISAGGISALALKSDGSLWAWGANTYGQLGNGSHTNEIVPVKIGSATNWKTVSAGYVHSLGLKRDGTLWGWGSNLAGEIGIPGDTDVTKPHQVGIDTNWLAISTGSDVSLALKKDGTLWAWGLNMHGEVGIGTITPGVDTPMQVGADKNWASISAGGSYALAIKTDGTLWAWGDNTFGDLGNGTTTNSKVPIQVDTATDWKIATASCQETSFAIKKDGTLWAWGDNTFGAFGIPSSSVYRSFTPIQITTYTDWQSVKAGNRHSMALRAGGSLWAAGENLWGQLGDGTYTESITQVMVSCWPATVPNLHPAENVSFYPNPFSQKATIKFENDDHQKYQLQVYNVLGQKVIDIDNVTSNFITIDRSGLNAGVYFYKLQNETGIAGSGKVIVE
ncbi:MAG TPA: T9SS type A sorting domain-containing protein [Flavipsychrobacter sp.]|nr:T9SS type A sorting domain-containing protein [Flavipsychrobacter sp.]